jgi:3-oxoacyl-[acyl-carrier protein] reductase
MGKLSNKVAIVTGAAKGIGAAIAKTMAAEGAAVVVNFATSAEAARKTVEAITAAGGRAIAVSADVKDAEAVEKLFAEAETAFGPVNVLVNNAATGGFSTFEATDEVAFRSYFDNNVLGVYQTTQAALRHFPKAGGAIVNIGTISSTNPVPMTSVYSASKAAIDTLSIALARELGPRNIRVNVVAPGYTVTDITRDAVDSDFGKMLAAGVPLGQRFAQPEEIAPTVVFLASDDAAWLTGERIRASGGVH